MCVLTLVQCAVTYCWVTYWEKENFPIDIVIWNTISDDLFILVTPYNKDVWDLGTFHRLFLFLHFIFPNGIYVNVPAILCVALDHPLWKLVWCLMYLLPKFGLIVEVLSLCSECNTRRVGGSLNQSLGRRWRCGRWLATGAGGSVVARSKGRACVA